MTRPLWLLTRTIALSVIFDVGVAAGQTVIVRSAPAGATIEVQMDGGAVRSATADASGDATFTVPLPSGSTEAAVQVFVDRCDPVLRVQLVRRGVPLPPPAAGCTRGEIWGAFLMRSVTTFVVDADTPGGSVHVAQGPPPRSWISRGEQAAGERRTFRTPPPTGLMLSAGAGMLRDSTAIDTMCGDVTDCTGGGMTAAGGANVTVWLTRFLGVQAGIAKRVQASASGSGTGYHFDSTVDTRLFTVSGLAGASAGALRIYGQGGVNRHRATFSTTQTADDATVVVGNVSQTIKGGTQTLQFTTEGWSWQFGGGIEAWATRFIALYADGQYVKLRGQDVTGGEARVDESVMMVMAGVRVRIGR